MAPPQTVTPPALPGPPTSAPAPRAPLIHVVGDRRLGHAGERRHVRPLPERVLERGPYLQLMNYTSLIARAFGKRDWVEHAAIDVYNTLAERRNRRVGKGELLVLIPRCLSKQALDGVLEIAGRYEVPVFVATRGQLARRVIRERRPRAVVAVACERDMMTGLRAVAGKLPVLGLTMRLPNGPCRDAMLDLETMERWVQSLVGAGA